MDWVKVLTDLSPAALLVVAIWVIAAKMVVPMLKSHKEAIDRIMASNATVMEAMRASIDENTKAVERAINHNEKIVTNHLNNDQRVNETLLAAMRDVTTALEHMNHRRRELDGN